jgi:CBS domain-containing protein
MGMKVLDSVSAILKQKGGEVWSIDPDATVYEALEVMANKGIGALLVLEGGKLSGVISERDYARKIILNGRSSKATNVHEIMTSPAITVSPNCTVDDAMRTVTEHRVRHLPVVDQNGAVLGLVSIGDLVKWIITSHEKTIAQLESYISGQSSVA